MRGTDVLAELHESMSKGQGEQLFPLLEALLASGGVTWRDLGAIGVGTGPGNFTGIRISVSAARGLGLALEIPVVGVSVLEACAFGQRGPTISTVAAPRGQAYVQGFGTRDPIEPQMVALDAVPAYWAEPGLVCVGSASDDLEHSIAATRVPAVHAPGAAIARLAAMRMADDPPAPVPMYIKPADAAPSRDAPPVILDDA